MWPGPGNGTDRTQPTDIGPGRHTRRIWYPAARSSVNMRALALVLGGILPLVVVPAALFPYEPPKIFLLTLLTSAALFVAAFRILQKKVSVSKILMSAHGLDVSIILFLIVAGISTIFSVASHDSFWGSTERATGVWFLFHLVILYGVFRIAANERTWKWLTYSVAISTLLISAYSIAQHFGFDFFTYEESFRLFGVHGPVRAFATLGHPNFLGSYLAIVLPIVLQTLFTARLRLWRVLAGASAGTTVLAILWTYSRGAWIAAAVGVLCFLVLRQQRTRLWYTQSTIIGGVVVAGTLAFLLVFSPAWRISQQPFVARLGTLTDMSQGSNLARVNEWHYALRLIPQRPWFGFGAETYYGYAERRMKDQREHSRDYQEPDASIADRLHTLPLDILWSYGIAGLLAASAVAGTAIARLRRHLRAGNRTWHAAVGAGLAAYLVGNLVSFDFSMSGIWLALFLAALGQGVDKTRQL